MVDLVDDNRVRCAYGAFQLFHVTDDHRHHRNLKSKGEGRGEGRRGGPDSDDSPVSPDGPDNCGCVHGADGADEVNGAPCLKGDDGAPGMKGEYVAPGLDGAPVPQGEDGSERTSGLDGINGVDGVGPIGPEGPEGPEGPPGTAGQDVDIFARIIDATEIDAEEIHAVSRMRALGDMGVDGNLNIRGGGLILESGDMEVTNDDLHIVGGRLNVGGTVFVGGTSICTGEKEINYLHNVLDMSETCLFMIV